MNASFIWGVFSGSLVTWALILLVATAYQAGRKKGGQ